MEQGLQEGFARLDAVMKQLVDRVRALPADQRAKRPNPRSWSPNEIVDHCATAEELYLDWIAKADDASLAGKTAKRSFMYKALLYTLNRAIGVPTMKEMEPRLAPTFDEAVLHWQQVRERFKGLFENKRSDEVLLKHPAFGYMSAEQMLEVFAAHVHYHIQRFPVRS